MSVRILHAADLHLDSPFEGLGADKAALRRSEQRQLLQRLAREANTRKADLLLLSGDILDTVSTYADTGEVLLSMLSELRIPAFIAPGNHDWYSHRSPYGRLTFPDNVHIFPAPRLESVTLPALGVRVWGAGYSSNRCPPLLRSFRVQKQPGLLDVLALHAEVGRNGSPYCPVTEAELAHSGLDYAALGHVHAPSGLRRAGSCWYAWPGCAQGRGFDECGPHGAALVELSADTCTLESVPLGGREYRCLTVEAGEDPLAAVLSALPADAARHIYRITLAGESTAEPDLAFLREQLEDRLFALTLRDETEPVRDLWDRAGENSLTGAFLRRMRRRLDAAANDGERELLREAVRLGVAALEGREVRL